jgi:hypothetical protein
MKVLVACEYSGTVRDAFAKLGHDAWSCDLLPTDKPGNHFQCDVRDVLSRDWDLLIGHPTCTFLCNSGVCHLHTDKTRWKKMEEGAKLFKLLWDAPIKKKCLENPIMHKYAKEIIGVSQSQIIQPYQFGHTESKATCLWLDNLPLLVSTNNVKEEMMKLPKNKRNRLHYLPPSPDRWKLRSLTYQGFADAMATQWGAHPACKGNCCE